MVRPSCALRPVSSLRFSATLLARSASTAGFCTCGRPADVISLTLQLDHHRIINLFETILLNDALEILADGHNPYLPRRKWYRRPFLSRQCSPNRLSKRRLNVSQCESPFIVVITSYSLPSLVLSGTVCGSDLLMSCILRTRAVISSRETAIAVVQEQNVVCLTWGHAG